MEKGHAIFDKMSVTYKNKFTLYFKRHSKWTKQIINVHLKMFNVCLENVQRVSEKMYSKLKK